MSKSHRLITAVSGLCLLAAVANGEFKFKHHYIDRDLPAKDYGQTSLVC